MKQLFLTLAIALFGYGANAQTYLPLAAGSGSPLTNTLFINNNTSTGVGLQLDGTAYSGHVWQFGDGITTNGTFSIKDATAGVERLAITSGGNVGIGTTSPGDLLQVNNGSTMRFQVAAGKGVWVNNEVNGGTSSLPGPLYLNYSSTGNTLLNSNGGNVGIGTASPTENLSVAGGSSSGSISLIPGTSTYAGYKLVLTTQAADEGFNMSMGGTTIMSAYGYNDANELGLGNLGHQNLLYLNSSGNVGIGTTTPDTKLAVNGTIHTKEVKVDLTGWPDYVFKPTYHLPSLTTVKTYIDKNRHLPDMPSEQQVTKDGINLGEMNKVLTKKVEELTLYAIRQDARIASLETAIAKLTTNSSK